MPIASVIRPSEVDPAPQSSGVLLRYLRETRSGALETGSIWRLSALRTEHGFLASPAGQEWQARPEIIEVSIIILEAAEGRIDAFEMVFDATPKRSSGIPTILVTSALAYAWSLRSPNAALMVLIIVFALHLLGGGDVKLLPAVVLFVPSTEWA